MFLSTVTGKCSIFRRPLVSVSTHPYQTVPPPPQFLFHLSTSTRQKRKRNQSRIFLVRRPQAQACSSQPSPASSRRCPTADSASAAVPRLPRRRRYSILGRRRPVLAEDRLGSTLVLYYRLVAYLVKNIIFVGLLKMVITKTVRVSF